MPRSHICFGCALCLVQPKPAACPAHRLRSPHNNLEDIDPRIHTFSFNKLPGILLTTSLPPYCSFSWPPHTKAACGFKLCLLLWIPSTHYQWQPSPFTFQPCPQASTQTSFCYPQSVLLQQAAITAFRNQALPCNRVSELFPLGPCLLPESFLPEFFGTLLASPCWKLSTCS